MYCTSVSLSNTHGYNTAPLSAMIRMSSVLALHASTYVHISMMRLALSFELIRFASLTDPVHALRPMRQHVTNHRRHYRLSDVVASLCARL